MATTTTSREAPAGPRSDWLTGAHLDGLVAVLSAWMIVGIFLDGRAHATGAPETFFSLEHATFYTAFLALAVVFGLVVRQERVRGATWREALPAEHRLALLGVAVFGLGGLADFAWHALFGIENDVEALLSPTHLLLIVGAVLLVSTPLRRAWRQGLGDGWRAQATALLSAALVLSMLLFATIYANVLTGGTLVVPGWVAADMGLDHAAVVDTILLERGITAILFHSALLVGFLLLLVRRFGSRLAPGAFTMLLTVSGLGVALFIDTFAYVPALVVGGLVADGLAAWLRPSAARVRAARLFALTVPTVIYAGYFAIYALRNGMPWTVHVWTGGIVLAGIVGFLVSVLVFPPAGAEPQSPPATDPGAD